LIVSNWLPFRAGTVAGDTPLIAGGGVTGVTVKLNAFRTLASGLLTVTLHVPGIAEVVELVVDLTAGK